MIVGIRLAGYVAGCGAGTEVAMGRGRVGRLIEAAAIIAAVGVGACGGGDGHGQLSGGGGTGGPGGPLSQRPSPAFPLFDDTRVHDISLTMSASDWQSIIDNSQGDTWLHA